MLNVSKGAWNVGFMMKLLFHIFCILSFGALVAESPQEGAIQEQRKEQDDARSDHHAAMSERLDSTPLAWQKVGLTKLTS